MKRRLPLTKNRNSIGLIVPDSNEYYWAEIIQGAREESRRHGYQLILSTTGYDSKKEIRQIKKFLKIDVKGIILQPLDKEESVRCYRELKKKIPLVFINRSLEQVKTDYVIQDPQKGAYKAVKHLIGMGHKRIGYIGEDRKRYYYFDRMRLSGYEKALKEAGIEFNGRLVIKAKEASPDIGYKEMKKFMKMNLAPTAIFAINDNIAAGALRAIKETGKKVPADFALAGYDDSSSAVSTDPPLTSVAVPKEKTGRKAVGVLLEKIGQEKGRIPRRIILEPKLIVRESSLTLPGPERRKCRICAKVFIPKRGNLRQTVCSHPACQETRQKENRRQWRERYADYFAKGSVDFSWKPYRAKKIKEWRQEHPDHLKHYRRIHQAKHREYMREYMKKYRNSSHQDEYREYMREYMKNYRKNQK